MKRNSLAGVDCPVARALDAIGDWWSLLIVRDAMMGLRRFGEFHKSLGLAKNILAARLRKLTDEGVLATVPVAGASGRRDYVLTQKGRELLPILVALRQWAERHSFDGSACSTALVDVATGLPVRPLELRSQDGRTLGYGEMRVKTLARKQERADHSRASEQP